MKIGMIGAGNMASALARGLGVPVVVSDAVPEKAERLAGETGGEAVAGNAEVAERSDVVVLCHKPAQLDEVAEQVGGRARTVVTILAATATEQVEARYPGVPVYRFIPNIPAEVGRGVLCYTRGSRDDAARMLAETMVGTAEYLKAHDFDTEALRVKVATPGGVTERGLMKLEER